MIGLIVLLTVMAVVALVVHLHYRHHPDYDLETVVDRTFAGLQFPLRDGRQMTGRDVTVLQKPALYSLQASMFVQHQGNVTDGFWYCAGPDGHFWMAIAQNQRELFLWKVTWVVRPLTAERLRSALQDNPKALQLAFGDVQIDRLIA